MRSKCFVCLLLVSLVYGQAAPPATPPAAATPAGQSAAPAPEKAPEVKVGPDDAVITLKGFCKDATQKGDACKTVITRAEFEKIVEGLQPNTASGSAPQSGQQVFLGPEYVDRGGTTRFGQGAIV